MLLMSVRVTLEPCLTKLLMDDDESSESVTETGSMLYNWVLLPLLVGLVLITVVALVFFVQRRQWQRQRAENKVVQQLAADIVRMCISVH